MDLIELVMNDSENFKSLLPRVLHIYFPCFATLRRAPVEIRCNTMNATLRRRLLSTCACARKRADVVDGEAAIAGITAENQREGRPVVDGDLRRRPLRPARVQRAC